MNPNPTFRLCLRSTPKGATQLAKGMALLEKAVDLEPTNVNALRHLGHISMNTKDYKKAEFWFNQVLTHTKPHSMMPEELEMVYIFKETAAMQAVCKSEGYTFQ